MQKAFNGPFWLADFVFLMQIMWRHLFWTCRVRQKYRVWPWKCPTLKENALLGIVKWSQCIGKTKVGKRKRPIVVGFCYSRHTLSKSSQVKVTDLLLCWKIFSSSFSFIFRISRSIFIFELTLFNWHTRPTGGRVS